MLRAGDRRLRRALGDDRAGAGIQGARPTRRCAAAGEVAWKDNRYPLRSLLPLLGEIDTRRRRARQIPVLLLKSGVQRAAIRVDEIIGNREIVVKTIGPQLARLAGHRRRHGARQRPGGADPQPGAARAPRARRRRGRRCRAAAARRRPRCVVEQQSGAPLVMVVDDSLTVRKITGRMLAREGYEVATAKDGVDALQQLQDIAPGLHPARRRDAAHGRLRIRAQRARRRGDARRSRSS